MCHRVDTTRVCISIHALLAESDRRGRPRYYIREQPISIHALLAESDDNTAQTRDQTQISIHALLAESDVLSRGFGVLREISIHALLAESDIAAIVAAFVLL